MWCFTSVWSLLLATVLSTGQGCTEDMLRKDSQRCCVLCPAGYYKGGTCGSTTAPHKCKRCGDGRFTDINNYVPYCEYCNSCDGPGLEMEKNCSHTNDAVCTCKEGYFHSGSGCRVCKPTCSDGKECGDWLAKCRCEWGFYREEKECLPCQIEDCLQKDACLGSCQHLAGFLATATVKAATSTTASALKAPFSQHWAMPLFLVILMTVLLLVILLLFTKIQLTAPDRRWPYFQSEKDPELPVSDPSHEQPHQHPSNTTSLMLDIHEGTLVTLSHIPNTSEYRTHSTPLLPKTEHRAWPATVLYAVIKEVPLRRWKEFLRLLSVADQQLERVELEAGLCSLEKQYLMLRLWSQGAHVALDDIYSALHYMDLAGCAQLLQDSLGKLQWKSGSGVALPLESPLPHRTAGATHVQL